ncbi:RNA polymerase II transcription mediator complex subunit 9-domain-containing protein [Daldinia loculata]|uniref:RNA polymerase II transcription mediator complex subunit 9-domain-containing protein n=1 Tax=Daldinia loculata TaxID=103429 RepID=UPI0020C47F74|nr:RNA polymerase II transcription mediator complex subunit 9-domain-containing protein [Daldinia loculata]KAI1643687.1 RNA polymerase II transcription mediator complex subunit 9-domain-containing protein [Daldinia loculata]KAI2777661.1 RNA polymerase II transcription mediator complex subunit 9-domain-containing protein [Daldinia loculata]
MASTTAAPKTQVLAMPDGLNPDYLDTLTELAVLLNRLRTPSGTATGNTPAPTPSHQPPPPPSHRHPHSQNQSQAQTNNGATTTTNTGELALKEIPPAADVLKHRFQRARVLIRGLPDMNRTIPNQEAEIAALEARLARQRDMLDKLREMGAQLAAQQDDGDRDRMIID